MSSQECRQGRKKGTSQVTFIIAKCRLGCSGMYRWLKGIVNCLSTGTWGPQNAIVARGYSTMTYIATSILISQDNNAIYVFHTQRLNKSTFPNHRKSKYLSDIYEEIIHQCSQMGVGLRHKLLRYGGEEKQLTPTHMDRDSKHSTLTKCWFNVGPALQTLVAKICQRYKG